MNKLGKPAAIPFDVAIKHLHDIRGDIVVGILFLPVALMVQKLAELLKKAMAANAQELAELLRGAMEEKTILQLALIFIAVKLALLLFVCILEILSISFVLLNFRSSPYHVMLIGLAALIFMVAMIVMSYELSEDEFRVAFVVSIVAACWVGRFIDWKAHVMGSDLEVIKQVTGFFAISAVLHIVFFPQ